MQRRSFLRHTSLLSTGIFSGLLQPAWSRNLNSALRDAEGVAPGELAGEEEFWYYIQQAFTGTPNVINLNSGGVSPAPRVVAEAMKQYYDYINEAPSLYMWRQLDQGREPLRRNFALFAGCNAEEIALNRNASEGLDTVIFGLPLQRGDEVVVCRQDYNHAVFSWQQREKRDGIRINWVDLQLPSEDETYLVQQYVKAFTPKTKVLNLTHMINWNGQVLPVAKIAAEARKRGILVLVDGAHSLAQLDFRISDLGADFFVTSLHKWTYAPIGTGALWMRREHTGTLWPLHGTDRLDKQDIRKFESLGTRPFYIEQATGKAIEFNEGIGIARKQARLHFLKNYWMERVKDLPGIRLSTSMDPRWGCAIGLVSFDGKKPNELDSHLFGNYKVHCTTIDWNGLSGVRITPNVFTTTKQLDVLVSGIRSYREKERG